MALGLAACGTDPTTVDYFGMTYDELQSSMEPVSYTQLDVYKRQE